MQTENFCQRCRSSSFFSRFSQAHLESERRPFVPRGTDPRYAPDRPFQLTHILLDVAVDPRTPLLRGKTTQTFRVVAPHQKLLKLDQVDLHIESVQIQNETVSFVIQHHELHIYLPKVFLPGEFIECRIEYHVEQPKRGIYFTGPDSDYRDKPYQVWTQGQDEDSRYWFPTLDYPNQKLTSEMIATVPHGFTAVSNGAFISKTMTAEGTRFHYRLGIPHAPYLITLTIAEYAQWSDIGPRNLALEYYVSPNRLEDGKRAFENTKKMVEVFENKTGVPYPYEKYSQVAVQDFIFGGMENTSATTQTDLTLHDARAHLDFSSDPLVSHELAHQWFGNLVTCQDWSHGWLNEGFATFMERIWVEEQPGPDGGFEEAKYYAYQDLKEYFLEDQKGYRRSIVCNQYTAPVHLFDAHLYQKGGLVLNLIRSLLGEVLFWKSVQGYLEQHREKTVETLDFIRAIEKTTGRNLRQFFDEWIFSAGYPEFEVSYQWHEDRKLTEWTIEQKQTGSTEPCIQDGFRIPIFHLPVILELTLEDGQKVSHSVFIQSAKEHLFLPSPTRPKRVRFDPHASIPKTLKFPRTQELLLNQLKEDSDNMGRIEAAQELEKIMNPEILRALKEALLNDPFWGVSVEIAKILGQLCSNAARDILIDALKSLQQPTRKDAKIRRAVLTALGGWKEDSVASVLQQFAKGDPSYFVEATATQAWAQVKMRAARAGTFSQTDAEKVESFLMQQAQKPSYRHVIANAAFQGLASLAQESETRRTFILQTLTQATRRGQETDTRVAAIRALGQILRWAGPFEKTRLLETFSAQARESHFQIRMQLIPVLEESGCLETLPILARIAETDTDGRVQRSAREAMERLLESQKTPLTVRQLQTTLEKLEEDHRKLKAQVESQILTFPAPTVNPPASPHRLSE